MRIGQITRRGFDYQNPTGTDLRLMALSKLGGL